MKGSCEITKTIISKCSDDCTAELKFSFEMKNPKNKSGIYDCSLCKSNFNKCSYGRFTCPAHSEFNLCWKCKSPDFISLTKQCTKGHNLKYVPENIEGTINFVCPLCHFESTEKDGFFKCDGEKENCNYQICKQCKIKYLYITRECQDGHPLFYHIPIIGSATKAKLTCNSCGYLIDDRFGNFSCHEDCNYNICTKCRPTPEKILDLFPCCTIKGHFYNYKTSFDDWEISTRFNCYFCFKSVPISEGAYVCEVCCFVVCSHCRSKGAY